MLITELLRFVNALISNSKLRRNWDNLLGSIQRLAPSTQSREKVIDISWTDEQLLLVALDLANKRRQISLRVLR
jgi:hypothetical protein